MTNIKKYSAENLINWEKSKHFRKSEFPTGVLDWMHYNIIIKLFSFRESLPNDCFLYPSPLVGGHVRHTIRKGADTDFHSLAYINGVPTRLSTATDFFAVPKYWFEVWWKAVSKFNSVGIYLNHFTTIGGKKVYYPMYHIDIDRIEPVYWVRNSKGEYVYFGNNPQQIIPLLQEAMDKWKL